MRPAGARVVLILILRSMNMLYQRGWHMGRASCRSAFLISPIAQALLAQHRIKIIDTEAAEIMRKIQDHKLFARILRLAEQLLGHACNGVFHQVWPVTQPQCTTLKFALAAIQQDLTQQAHAVLVAPRQIRPDAQYQMRLWNLIPSAGGALPEAFAYLRLLWVHLCQHKILCDLLNGLPAPGNCLVTPLSLQLSKGGIWFNRLCPTDSVHRLARRGKRSFRLVRRSSSVPQSLAICVCLSFMILTGTQRGSARHKTVLLHPPKSGSPLLTKKMIYSPLHSTALVPTTASPNGCVHRPFSGRARL